MGISGIGTGTSVWTQTGRTQTGRSQQMGAEESFADKVSSAAGQKGHTVYLKTDDMLYSGGNGTGLSFYLKYAENSTAEDPAVVAKGVDENGDEFEQIIHINKVDPKSATIVEMRALEAYTGVKKQFGFTSLPLSTGGMGLKDRMDFMDMFKNVINDMKQLSQYHSAQYYQYSMQTYRDFMDRK